MELRNSITPYNPSESLAHSLWARQVSSWLASAGVVLRAGLGWVFDLGISVEMPFYKKKNLALINRAAFLCLLLALPGSFLLMLMGFGHPLSLLFSGTLVLTLILALNGAHKVGWAQAIFAFAPAGIILIYTMLELSSANISDQLVFYLIRQGMCFSLLLPVILYGFEATRTTVGILGGCTLVLLGFDVASLHWGASLLDNISGINHGLFSLLSIVQLLGLAGCVLYVQNYTIKQEQLMRDSNEKLQSLVVKDGMTGLYNRSFMEQMIGDAINRSKRSGTPLSLLMIDIDYFKQINDIFGHQAGDEVLLQLTKLLEGSKRSTDYLGRWGGDELVLLLGDTNLQGAMKVAEKLRIAVVSHIFPHRSHLTISLGASEYCNGETQPELIKRADAAMYQAKHAGRNRVEVERSQTSQ